MWEGEETVLKGALMLGVFLRFFLAARSRHVQYLTTIIICRGLDFGDMMSLAKILPPWSSVYLPVGGHVQIYLGFVSTLQYYARRAVAAGCRLLFLHASVPFARSRRTFVFSVNLGSARYLYLYVKSDAHRRARYTVAACHYPQDFWVSYTDLAPFRLCPAHAQVSTAAALSLVPIPLFKVAIRSVK